VKERKVVIDTTNPKEAIFFELCLCMCVLKVGADGKAIYLTQLKPCSECDYNEFSCGRYFQNWLII